MAAWTQARSQLARAVQRGEPPEKIAELRRVYRAARLEHHIRTGAPGLTDDERARLAAALLSGGGDGNVAA